LRAKGPVSSTVPAKGLLHANQSVRRSSDNGRPLRLFTSNHRLSDSSSADAHCASYSLRAGRSGAVGGRIGASAVVSARFRISAACLGACRGGAAAAAERKGSAYAQKNRVRSEVHAHISVIKKPPCRAIRGDLAYPHVSRVPPGSLRRTGSKSRGAPEVAVAPVARCPTSAHV